LDCSVRETRQRNGTYIVSTTDFFFPLVDSPYLQGRIGASNVLSDLYAQGVQHCDFMLMLLAACLSMPADQRSICTREMVRGFRDACDEAGTAITGGQTVLNPWPVIGGVATSVVTRSGYVPSDGAQPGDVVVLTKPLGTQVAVNVHEWRNSSSNSSSSSGNKFWDQIVRGEVLTEVEAEDMMHAAVCSMVRLNRNGSSMMLKHGANAGTDVTGFGLLGHAQNLMENQVQPVGMEIHTLPLIVNTLKVNDRVFDFRLKVGYSAETSGGLLVCMPLENARAFVRELEELDGCPAWIIGNVIPDESRRARILEDVKYLEV
jgi:selenide, water dikinase